MSECCAAALPHQHAGTRTPRLRGNICDQRRAASCSSSDLDVLLRSPQTMMYSHLKERNICLSNKCTRHQSTTTCLRNVLTMDVWCEGEMGVATDVSIPPSVGPARSANLIHTVRSHRAAMCETSQIHFKSGVRSSKISSRGSAPHPARAHALNPRRVTIDNILLPGRVGNYWTNIFDKSGDPYLS